MTTNDDKASKIRTCFRAVAIAKKALVLVHDVCEFVDEHALPKKPDENEKEPPR